MGVKYTITYGTQSKEITDGNNNSFILTYGSQSETISAGNGRTLTCANKVMTSNVVVGTHTLECSGKIMKNNVAISSQSYSPNVTITITGDGKGEAVAVINGVEYGSDAVVSVAPGTVITLKVWGLWISPGRIYVNGNQVASGSSESYNVTVTQNSTVDFSGSIGTYGRIHFTG